MVRSSTNKALVAIIAVLSVVFFSGLASAAEVREYNGIQLSPFDRKYDNSIKGPQHVDKSAYRLEVTGLVQKPLSLAYDEVLLLPHVKKVYTVHCIEGWDETLLYEGVLLKDVFAKALPKRGVKTVIFYAADGYSSSVPYDYVVKNNIMIGAFINGRVLDDRRGFPFQVAADDKYGYKWVKWLKKIELSDKYYEGYWERRGYSNDAEVR